MPETRHPCPGDCGRTVGHRMFACGDDWRRLPWELKTEILRTFRRKAKDRRDTAAREAHTAAMVAVTNWYREHPIRTEARRG